MRYSDKELSLIKNTFAEQLDLMVLIRKFLLQGEMDEKETALIQKYAMNPEILAILKKAVNPKVDKLAPPFETVDLLASMDLNPTAFDHAYRVVKARYLASQYLDNRFAVLEGKDVEEIEFDSLHIPTEDPEQTYLNIIARNFLLSHIDSQLFNQLMVIAGQKTETPEQQKKRLTKDSTK